MNTFATKLGVAVSFAGLVAGCGSEQSGAPSTGTTLVDAGSSDATGSPDRRAADTNPSHDATADMQNDGFIGDAGKRSSCALPNYPTPDCTGAPRDAKLTVHDGDLVIERPGVYENLEVTGAVFICASDVTLKNSVVFGLGANMAINTRDWPCDNQLRTNVLVEDVTIKPSDFDLPATNWARYEADKPIGTNNWPEIAIGPSGFTCRRCKIITRDGPRAGSALDGPDTTSANIRIEDSYIFARSDGYSEPCNHTDGFQGYGGGTNVVLEHVTIDIGNVCSTAAVFAGDYSTSMEVYDSLLMGGGYTILLGDDPGLVADYEVRGVKIVEDSYSYGPARCPEAKHLKLWSDVSTVTVDPLYRVTSTVQTLPSCD